MTFRSTVPEKKNPYNPLIVRDVGFTIGTETSDVINVALQLKGRGGSSLAVRGRVKAYLAADANGDTLATSPEALGGGTNGLLVPDTGVSSEGLLAIGTLLIDATPEKFKTTSTAAFLAGGAYHTKTATTAIVFSAAHVVSASKFGVILIQINAAGTVSTKVPLATQAYTTAPLALAALPVPDAGCVALGYIAIAAKAATWTANTDDMTNASDLTTATFVDSALMTTIPRSFDLISEANGTIDVRITDTRAPRTYYLVVVLPDGSLKVSSAIAFA